MTSEPRDGVVSEWQCPSSIDEAARRMMELMAAWRRRNG